MSRLPTIGGDSGAWGSVLNDFLSQSFTSSGQLGTVIVNGSASFLGSASFTQSSGSTNIFGGTINASRTYLSGNTPTMATAIGGIGSVASVISGNDARGTVSFLTTTGAGTAVSITFVNSYSTTPVVQLTAYNKNAGTANEYVVPFASPGSGFYIALSAGTYNNPYSFSYSVIG
jgi:hypothetical protein